MAAVIEKTNKKTLNSMKVKKGDIVAVQYFTKVTEVHEKGRTINVDQLDTEGDFSIRGRELVDQCFSADQFETTEAVTKTKAAEILSTSFNTPFTVVFVTQEGETRLLRGRLVQPEPLLGRSSVEDLDIPRTSHRLRLVDHRTIQSLIVNNVKYTVK